MNVNRSIVSAGLAAAVAAAFVSAASTSPRCICRFAELQPVAVQGRARADRCRRAGRAGRVVGRPERRRSAGAICDRQRPASGARSGGQESRRAVDHARQEPRAGISRRHRHSPDGRRSGEPAEGGGYRADRRGDQQEPVVRVLGRAARDAGVAGNARRSGMAAVSTASTGARRRAWRTWPGSGCRLADPQPDAGHAADAVRDSARRRVVPHARRAA